MVVAAAGWASEVCQMPHGIAMLAWRLPTDAGVVFVMVDSLLKYKENIILAHCSISCLITHYCLSNLTA